ncbi:MAG: HAMP domain-containing protein [Desulfuromonadales bacterium]
MNPDTSLKKRKFLNLSIHSAMQWRMIARISSILFICLLLSSAVYYHFANVEITSSFKLFHIKARSFLDMLLPTVAYSFVFSLVVGFIASLFFPKNYAGSVYRIEQDLKQIREGDLRKRITLRKGDEVKELADQVNTLVQQFHDQVLSIRATLERLPIQESGGPNDSLEKHLERMEKCRREVLAELAIYHVHEHHSS